MYIHPDRLPDIEAALRYLGLPPLSNPGGDPNQATPHQENVNHPIFPQFQRLNSPATPQPELGCYSTKDERDSSDLASSFSRLSTSDSFVQVPTASFPVRRPPVVQPNTSPRKNMKKYYVVTVGKCTGVFWDEW